MEPSLTAEDLMFVSARLQEGIVSIRNSIVLFMRSPNNAHQEGGAWFGLIEGNLASAHSHLFSIIESLKDCDFNTAFGLISIVKSLIMGCRYITAFCRESRQMYLPDDYNNFMRDANDTISELNGYIMNLYLQLERKKNGV